MKDKKRIVIGIGSIVGIVLVIGISYALWSFNIVQTDVNTVTSGCLKLELKEETNAISLEKAYPITDEEASSLKPYTFTITNKCSSDASYNLSLEMMEVENRLLTKYVAIKIDDKSKTILGSLAETEVSYNKGDYTPIEGRMLISGTLKGDESKTHSIRLWIDESVTIEDDVMNKTFIGKVVLNATIKGTSVTLADYIIDLADTSEDVVKMEHEETEQTLALIDYRYVGANPNNYVCLEDSGKCTEDQLYRIIGVIPTQSSENGEYEPRVKLIKATSYGSIAWESSNVNDWTTSSLKNTLNTTYLDSISEYQKYIDVTKWYLGGHSTIGATTTAFYNYERGTTVVSGRPTSVVAKIGLMYPSDYGYAVGGEVRATCLASNLNTYDSNNCYTNDWLFLSGSNQWTISPSSSIATSAFFVYSNGGLYGNYVVANATVIRPVFSLKSNVGILAGDGTKTNPWTLE